MQDIFFNYEIIKLEILYVGWPLLIIGSIYIIYQSYKFYVKLGRTPIAKLVTVFTVSTIITMYSLGFVSTIFLMVDTLNGVTYVLPIFSIWFVFMILIFYFAFKLNREAISYNEMVNNFNQSKDDFVAIVSHQLRTPLSGMKWTLDILSKDESLNDNIKEKIKSIKDANRKMIDLISNLLSVVKVETGSQVAKKEAVNVTLLIDDILRMFKSSLDKNRQRVSIIKDGIERNINADKFLLAEALKNIISNSIYYGGVESEIKIKIVMMSRGIIISVHNDGPSIPIEKQKTIFDKFSRERVDEKKIIQEIGGLGLYIAKSFVELCGGTIIVNSNDIDGTTFIVELRDQAYGDNKDNLTDIALDTHTLLTEELLNKNDTIKNFK